MPVKSEVTAAACEWVLTARLIISSHTTNQVPFIMTVPEGKDLGFIAEDNTACLADVAPTVLALMGLDKPGGTC